MIDDTVKKLQDLSAKVENGQEDLVTEDDIQTLMNALEEILTPMDRLSTNRWRKLTDNLIRFTTEVFKMGDGKIARRRSLPAVKIDKEKFTQTLQLMNKMGILEDYILESNWITNGVEYENSLALRIHSWAAQNHEEDVDDIIEYYYELLLDGIKEHEVSVNAELESKVIALYERAVDEVGSDTDDIREYMINSFASEQMTMEPSLSLFGFSRRPSEQENTQKGRGIRRLAESGETVNSYSNVTQNTGLHLPNSGLWLTEPALFLDLETAKNITAEELKVSVAAVRLGVQQGLIYFPYDNVTPKPNNLKVYVRTCPASPRPGVLPNMLAHSAVELEQCVKELASAMLDPSHPDYDPEGSLCLMRYIEAPMSAVHVKGHEYFVVALGHAGVTAAEGSHLVMKIQPELAEGIADAVDYLSLDDDMVNHEIEFVWPSLTSPNHQNISPKILSQHMLSQSQYQKKQLPIITQVRGLLADKDPIKPPSLFQHPETGEQMATIYRGNVPNGSVEQLVIEDVGAGCLSDCAKLEQMIQSGEVPEGLVVYCPTGSTNCHAAGVCSEAGIPIIYAPVHDNGICWTEIDSWVTDVEGVTPQPYDCNQFKEYFLLGCREGDRYWDYGYAPMSQYFHTFLNGPVNDPRLEAFYAGMYSTWLVKAALAVALGETRHYFTSCGRNRQPKNLIALFAIFRHLGVKSSDLQYFEWSNRSSYYELLKRNEIGIESMLDILLLLRGVFDAKTSRWGSSYGGKAYAESVEKALVVCRLLDNAIMSHDGDGEFDLQKLMGAVNILEHATHNNANFFDKFVANTSFFDIGTHDHRYLHLLQQQFFVCLHWHTHFYQLIGETWRISDNAKALYEEIEPVPSIAYIIAASEREKDANEVLKRLINTVPYADQESVDAHISNEETHLIEMADALWDTAHYDASVEEWYTTVVRIAREAGYEYLHHAAFTCDLPFCTKPLCRERAEMQALVGQTDMLPALDKLWDFMSKCNSNTPMAHRTIVKGQLDFYLTNAPHGKVMSFDAISSHDLIEALKPIMYNPVQDGSKPHESDRVFCEAIRMHSNEKPEIEWNVTKSIHQVPIVVASGAWVGQAVYHSHLFYALMDEVIVPIHRKFLERCENNFTLMRLILDSLNYLTHYEEDGTYTWFYKMEEKQLAAFRKHTEDFAYDTKHAMLQTEMVTLFENFMKHYDSVVVVDDITGMQTNALRSPAPSVRTFMMLHDVLLKMTLYNILPPEEKHMAMVSFTNRPRIIELLKTIQDVLPEKEVDDLMKELIE